MKVFNCDAFHSNIREATNYIRSNKILNMDCRYRLETNKTNENVKVYVIGKNKIVMIAHFEDGKLLQEIAPSNGGI
ncbi:MAG: hypothetical protein RR585_04505 [Coprobacillus sp.]